MTVITKWPLYAEEPVLLDTRVNSHRDTKRGSLYRKKTIGKVYSQMINARDFLFIRLFMHVNKMKITLRSRERGEKLT